LPPCARNDTPDAAGPPDIIRGRGLRVAEGRIVKFVEIRTLVLFGRLLNFDDYLMRSLCL